MDLQAPRHEDSSRPVRSHERSTDAAQPSPTPVEHATRRNLALFRSCHSTQVNQGEGQSVASSGITSPRVCNRAKAIR
jgi:hypothetical protein